MIDDMVIMWVVLCVLSFGIAGLALVAKGVAVVGLWLSDRKSKGESNFKCKYVRRLK